MSATTAWDESEWDGDEARGWTVMGRLRQRQSLLSKEAADARRRVAKRESRIPDGASGYMVPTSGELEDFMKARRQGGPTVLAFLFAPPGSDAIRMLDARGEYFDIRTGDTWDLFFPGYYRSATGSAFERENGALQVGGNYARGWYFSPAGFNDLRARIERSSGNRWQYSGGTDLVLINGWLVERSPRPREHIMIQETSAQDLARKQIVAAFAADWPTLERLYADDVQYRDPDTRLSSRAAVLNRLRGQVDAFAGFDYRISHTYSDSADGAVVEWNMSGDYAGKPVSLDIITAYDFLGDRIVSERNYWDNAALLAQLG